MIVVVVVVVVVVDDAFELYGCLIVVVLGNPCTFLQCRGKKTFLGNSIDYCKSILNSYHLGLSLPPQV